VKNVAFMWFYLTLSRASRHMYPSLSSEFIIFWFRLLVALVFLRFKLILCELSLIVLSACFSISVRDDLSFWGVALIGVNHFSVFEYDEFAGFEVFPLFVC